MALCERIVDVYEAAFRAFDVLESERIGYATKLEVVWIVERSCFEGDDSIPTALHRDRVA